MTIQEDKWFRTLQWQQSEAEAQKDVDTGDVLEFDSVDELLAYLHRK